MNFNIHSRLTRHMKIALSCMLVCLSCCFAVTLAAQPAAVGPAEITRMTVDEIMGDMRSNEALYSREPHKTGCNG